MTNETNETNEHEVERDVVLNPEAIGNPNLTPVVQLSPDSATYLRRNEPAECECFPTPEDSWLSAASCGYGSGYEPGSQVEQNPDCPIHGYVSRVDLWSGAWDVRPLIDARLAAAWDQGYARGTQDESADLQSAANPFRASEPTP